MTFGDRLESAVRGDVDDVAEESESNRGDKLGVEQTVCVKRHTNERTREVAQRLDGMCCSVNERTCDVSCDVIVFVGRRRIRD